MKVAIVFAYDGRDFYGSQRQVGFRTVQQEMEEVLSFLYGREVGLDLASRTDKGVHAKMQVGAYQVHDGLPLERLVYVLNRMLPRDIVVKKALCVPEDFHPRFSPSIKTYEYVILKEDNLFLRPYTMIEATSLDVKAMKRAGECFVGTHDFYSFSNRKKGEKSTVRTITSLEIEEDEKKVMITVKGKGFLYKMVRILVAYLIEVGKGEMDWEKTRDILLSKSRKLTRKVAEPQGLYLKEISYKDGWNTKEVIL